MGNLIGADYEHMIFNDISHIPLKDTNAKDIISTFSLNITWIITLSISFLIILAWVDDIWNNGLDVYGSIKYMASIYVNYQILQFIITKGVRPNITLKYIENGTHKEVNMTSYTLLTYIQERYNTYDDTEIPSILDIIFITNRWI